MESILNKIREVSQFQQLLNQLRTNGKQLPGLGLPRAARLPVLAVLHQDLNRPILLITDRAVFGFPSGRLTLLELMPGETLDTVRATTEAKFEVR